MGLLAYTSAVVLLRANGKVHTSAPSQEFLGMLDLSSGAELVRQGDRFCSHHSEVIMNRKHCILNLALDCIENDGIRQVVILGAGMDALSIELCSHYECRVFDIDLAGMERKERHVGSLRHGLRGTLRCVTADVTKRLDVMSGITACGWDPDKPSLVVVEGLSAYLTAGQLWSLISVFSTTDRSNRMILEYMIPLSDIHEKIRPAAMHGIGNIIKKTYESIIPIAAFPLPHHPPGLTARNSDWAFVTRYRLEDIKARLSYINGTVLSHHDMREAEARRTGRGTVFGRYNGWIEICNIAM